MPEDETLYARMIRMLLNNPVICVLMILIVGMSFLTAFLANLKGVIGAKELDTNRLPFTFEIHENRLPERQTDLGSEFLDYVIVDFQTTGITPTEDEIIIFDALKIRSGMIIGTFSEVIKPSVSVSDIILEIAEVTNEDLEKGKSFKEVYRMFTYFVGDDPMVAHNAKFDQKFLASSCKKNNIQMLSNPFYDTYPLFRKYYVNSPNYRLSSVISTTGHTKRGSGLMEHVYIYILLNNILLDEKWEGSIHDFVIRS